MNTVFLLSEMGITLLFLLCLVFAWRNRKRDNSRDLSTLVSAAIFAALFENLNVLQIHGRGSYSYNAQFHVFIGQVPLFIILAWAVILWTAMQISDATPLRTQSLRTRDKIVCDAVLAVLLDLSFDATAIRHGFWNWHGVALSQAWFGVPAGNFFGWMFVALAFSFCVRVLDWRVQSGKLKPHFRFVLQVLIAPIVAFVLYRAIENSNNAVLRFFGWNPANATTDKLALCVFFAQFFALIIWSLRLRRAQIQNVNIEYSKPNENVLIFARLCRIFFHVFAVCGLFALPFSSLLAQQKPALLAVAGFVCLLDWLYEKRLCATRAAREHTISL